MGLLVQGKWQEEWYDTKSHQGRFVRQESDFRQAISPPGEGKFPAQAGRYHLYVSLACPWAHRTILLRKLKGLEGVISLSVVDWWMGPGGWRFTGDPGHLPQGLKKLEFLHQLYQLAQADFTGRVTVPVLWDKETDQLVNNESSEIIRFLNSAFDPWASGPDFYPQALRAEIDQINQEIYQDINNGVYRCGFATSQEAYAEAFHRLFAALDRLEERLSTRRYLLGGQVTEADWRLFTTLIRFDAVYVGHFKCNLRPIASYPQLSGYLKDLYQWPGVAETVDFTHIKGHYYKSHPQINPSGVIPLGPQLDLTSAHGRERLA